MAATGFFTAGVLTWSGLPDVLRFVFRPCGRASCVDCGNHRAPRFGLDGADGTPGDLCCKDRRYLVHDRDARFSELFRDTVRAGGVKPLKLPAKSPNLNSFAPGCVR